MTLRLALGLLLAAGVSTSAHAGFISGNYTLSNGNTVALQGLEWMPLTYTAGLSRADVEDGFTDNSGTAWGAGEWKYANRLQTETLIGSLWDQTFAGWSQTNGPGALWFLTYFGGLANFNDNGTTHDTLSRYGWSNYDYSFFLFGADGDCHSTNTRFGCIGRVTAASNYDGNQVYRNLKNNELEISYGRNSGALGEFNESYGLSAGINNDNMIWSKGQPHPFHGSLLVRQNPATAPAPVSAPTSLSVVAIGLLSLLLRRRRPSHQ